MIVIEFPTVSRKVLCVDNVEELKTLLEDDYKLELSDFQEEVDQIYACVGEVKHWQTRSKHILMFINLERLSPKPKNFIIATLAHEAFHAAVAVTVTLGDTLCKKNEERVAYEMDYILSSLLDEYVIE